MRDIMDATLDDIRDYVHADLTDQQILDVLKNYEDQYNELIADHDHDSWDIQALRDEIVDALEDQISEELGAKHE